MGICLICKGNLVLLDQTTTPETIITEKFGELIKADSIVCCRYEPKDRPTKDYIEEILGILGLTRPSENAQKRRVRCLSDIVYACIHSKTGFVGCPSASDNFTGGPYGRNIHNEVRKALCREGFLRLEQKSSKADKLCAIYSLEICYPPLELRFKRHGIGPMVEVRTKGTSICGKLVNGKSMPRRQFEPQFGLLEAKMKAINRLAINYPLATPAGEEFGLSKRIFNNGSLVSGGRMYGPWQNRPELERLQMTIGGEPVCEIDLTACYLNICHSMSGGTNHLGRDPYQQIKFVSEIADQEQRKKMRKLAKLLVSVWVSSRGQQTRFPSGEKDEMGRSISVREEYQLRKKVKFMDLMKHIFDAFPFFERIDKDSPCLMFKESEIFSTAILDLTAYGVPAYPMHDAIIVRLSDMKLGVELLQSSLMGHLNFVPEVEVSSLDQYGDIVSDYAERLDNDQGQNDQPTNKSPTIDWNLDDDFDVLEDY